MYAFPCYLYITKLLQANLHKSILAQTNTDSLRLGLSFPRGNNVTHTAGNSEKSPKTQYQRHDTSLTFDDKLYQYYVYT